jgi:5-methylcytosine-specific restriction enzyme B
MFMKAQTAADRIREHLKKQFLEPARLRGEITVRIVAGDIHKGLGLRNQVPNVCQVLRSQKFLNENRLVLEKFEGPPSGLGTTATFTYRLAAEGASQQEQESLFLRLRGIAKDTFASLGGGEKFIRGEREHFHQREEGR